MIIDLLSLFLNQVLRPAWPPKFLKFSKMFPLLHFAFTPQFIQSVSFSHILKLYSRDKFMFEVIGFFLMSLYTEFNSMYHFLYAFCIVIFLAPHQPSLYPNPNTLYIPNSFLDWQNYFSSQYLFSLPSIFVCLFFLIPFPFLSWLQILTTIRCYLQTINSNHPDTPTTTDP